MLSKKEILEYCVKNQYATNQVLNGSEDYVAGRCCIINLLGKGKIFICQAVEKVIKAYIYLESNGQQKLTTNHDPFDLKEKLKKINPKYYKLDIYDEQLKKLYDHYLTRYDDNEAKYGTNGFSSKELEIIDKLWLELMEDLPMPDEVKCRTKFFSDILRPNPHWNDEFWTKQHNPVLNEKIDTIKEYYKKFI